MPGGCRSGHSPRLSHLRSAASGSGTIAIPFYPRTVLPHESMEMCVSNGLEALMSARSIAIIGASNDPQRIGGKPLAYLLRSGFDRPVYPVNPNRATVQGVPAFPSVVAIPHPVDLAVLAIPAAEAVGAVRECGEKGVRVVVALTGGFAELGEAGREVQDEMVAIARAHDMRILGPNVIGAFNLTDGTLATFIGTFPERHGERSIALVSQSGGYASHVLWIARQRGLSVDQLVSTGNECDIDAGEVIEWMATAVGIGPIIAYVEGVRDPFRFRRALAAAKAARKPIVMLKVGATEAGARAAASHTAALAGADGAYQAVFDAYGVYRASTTEEAIDIALAVSIAPLPRGRRVAAISMSGGVAVQFADAIAEAGLTLATLTDETRARLSQLIPACCPDNPIDTTAQILNEPAKFQAFVRAILADPGVDALVGYVGVAVDMENSRTLLRDSLHMLRNEFPDTPIALSMAARDEIVRPYIDMGVIAVGDPAHAVRAIAGLVALRTGFDAPAPVETDPGFTIALPDQATLNEHAAKALVAQAGIRSPRETIVPTAKAAAEAADRMACPLAVKLISADITHKSDVGGVILDVQGGVAAAEAVTAIASSVTVHAPDARIEGYLLSEMVLGGTEFLLGVTRGLFGPMVMVGAGGVITELIKDVAVALAPVDIEGARALIARLKTAALLDGYRGRPRGDAEALARAVAGLSQLAAANPAIDTIEVNPVMVMPEGEGIVALDAVVTMTIEGAHDRPPASCP